MVLNDQFPTGQEDTEQNDAGWLYELDGLINDHLRDPELNNEYLADHFGLSARSLHRRVHRLSGVSPVRYIRNYRLDRAKEMLTRGLFRTVNEAAYAVGYTNVSYFIRQYILRFEKSPLDSLREAGWR